MAWTQETLDRFSVFREACDEFMNETTATKLRTADEAGNHDVVVTQWDTLGVAVGELFDYLSDPDNRPPLT